MVEIPGPQLEGLFAVFPLSGTPEIVGGLFVFRPDQKKKIRKEIKKK